VGEKVAIPASSYHFRIANFIPSANLVESYRRDDKGKPALEIEYVNQEGAPTRQWIEFGHTRNLVTVDGSLMATFAARTESRRPEAHP
jgi:hypothetical protein